MIKRLFLIGAVCLTLTACGRRIRTNPTPTAPGQPATQAVSDDPLGDEIEQMLTDLDTNNTAADSAIEQLPAP